MSNEVPRELFDYDDLLDDDDRAFLQQKTIELHGLLQRTAEHILAIGQRLREVKQRLPHGAFLPWLQKEFGMSRWTAQHLMQVADRFGDKWGNFHHLSVSVLYELASPSTKEEIIEQVTAGQVEPTLEAIKKAKEALKQAEDAERQARAETQVTQQHLLLAHEEVQAKQTTIEQLTSDIMALQEQVATLSASQGQVVQVPVVPPELTAQLEALQQQVHTLSQQRETLAQEVTRLQEDARIEMMQRLESDEERRVRLHWAKITNEFQRSVRTLLADWPSSLDILVFGANEWNRLSQVQELARRFLEACCALTQIVQGSIVEGATERTADEEGGKDIS